MLILCGHKRLDQDVRQISLAEAVPLEEDILLRLVQTPLKLKTSEFLL